MELMEKLKNFYYFFEDKYYEILDKINEKVPVYKLIDPIDKIFPSFILFSLVFFLFIGLLGWALFSPLLFGKQFYATIEVLDKDNLPIQEASISLQLADENVLFSEGITDEFGQFSVDLPSEEVSVNITVKPKEMGEVNFKKTLIAGETITLKIAYDSAGFEKKEEIKQYSITLVDASSKKPIESKSAVVSLSCSLGSSPGPQTNVSGNGLFKFTLDKLKCGTITAKGEAPGYQEKSIFVNDADETISLSKKPTTETKASLYVKVYRGNIEAVLKEIKVTVCKSDNTDCESAYTNSLGLAEFLGLDVGYYNITALETSTSASKSISDVLLTSGNNGKELELPSVKLDAAGNVVTTYKLSLKVSDSNGALGNVGITIYKDSVFFNTAATSPAGTFVMPINDADNNSYFKAFLIKEGHIPKVVSLNKYSASSDQKDEITLDLFDGACDTECGKVLVKVTDFDDGLPVNLASVSLFDETNNTIPWYLAKDSNVDGYVVFEPLPVGAYFAKAKKENKQGSSEHKALEAGKTLQLDVKITIGNAKINVYVFDSGTENPIANADVNFFLVSGAQYTKMAEGCKTNSEGFCFKSIQAEKSLFLGISAFGYISQIVGELNQPIVTVSNDVIDLNVYLDKQPAQPQTSGVVLEFAGIYKDQEGIDPASIVLSDLAVLNSYYVKYYVYINEAFKPGDANKTLFNFFVDSAATEILPDDYVIKLAETPLYSPSLLTAVPSKCYKNNSQFTLPACTSGTIDGKSVLAEFPSISNVSFPVMVKVNVNKGKNQGTPFEFSAKAKAITESNSHNFKGELAEIDCALQEEKGFFWDVSLVNNETQQGMEIAPDADHYKVLGYLQSGKEYGLNVKIINCSGADFTGTYSLGTNISNISIDDGSYYEPAIYIIEASGDYADLSVNLKISQGNSVKSQYSLHYDTLQIDKKMEIITGTNILYPDVENIIVGTIKNSAFQTGVLANLNLFKKYANAEGIAVEEDIGISTITDADGSFTLPQAGKTLIPVEGETYILKATASNYKDGNKEFLVTMPFAYGSVDCMQVTPAPESTAQIDIPSNPILDIIAVNNCSEEVIFTLNSQLSTFFCKPNPQTGINDCAVLSVETKIDDSVPEMYLDAPKIPAGKTLHYKLTFKSGAPQGKIPMLLVMAKGWDEVTYSLLYLKVNDSTSCFSLTQPESAEYDFTNVSAGSGSITKKAECLLANDVLMDYFETDYPTLAFYSNTVDGSFTNNPLSLNCPSDTYSFDYSIDLNLGKMKVLLPASISIDAALVAQADIELPPGTGNFGFGEGPKPAGEQEAGNYAIDTSNPDYLNGFLQDSEQFFNCTACGFMDYTFNPQKNNLKLNFNGKLNSLKINPYIEQKVGTFPVQAISDLIAESAESNQVNWEKKKGSELTELIGVDMGMFVDSSLNPNLASELVFAVGVNKEWIRDNLDVSECIFNKKSLCLGATSASNFASPIDNLVTALDDFFKTGNNAHPAWNDDKILDNQCILNAGSLDYFVDKVADKFDASMSNNFNTDNCLINSVKNDLKALLRIKLSNKLAPYSCYQKVDSWNGTVKPSTADGVFKYEQQIVNSLPYDKTMTEVEKLLLEVISKDKLKFVSPTKEMFSDSEIPQDEISSFLDTQDSKLDSIINPIASELGSNSSNSPVLSAIVYSSIYANFRSKLAAAFKDNFTGKCGEYFLYDGMQESFYKKYKNIVKKAQEDNLSLLLSLDDEHLMDVKEQLLDTEFRVDYCQTGSSDCIYGPSTECFDESGESCACGTENCFLEQSISCDADLGGCESKVTFNLFLPILTAGEIISSSWTSYNKDDSICLKDSIKKYLMLDNWEECGTLNTLGNDSFYEKNKNKINSLSAEEFRFILSKALDKPSKYFDYASGFPYIIDTMIGNDIVDVYEWHYDTGASDPTSIANIHNYDESRAKTFLKAILYGYLPSNANSLTYEQLFAKYEQVVGGAGINSVVSEPVYKKALTDLKAEFNTQFKNQLSEESFVSDVGMDVKTGDKKIALWIDNQDVMAKYIGPLQAEGLNCSLQKLQTPLNFTISKKPDALDQELDIASISIKDLVKEGS